MPKLVGKPEWKSLIASNWMSTASALAGRYGERHLLVCNARYDAATEVTLAGPIAAFDPETGSYQAADRTFTLAPGAARLLRLAS